MRYLLPTSDGIFRTDVPLVPNVQPFVCEASRWKIGPDPTAGSVSGAGTVWNVLAKDMELESALIVGRTESGLPGTGNTLIVEDGAYLHVSDVESYKNGRKVENLTGILVGIRSGDNGNALVVRDGAIVTNDYWTGVGGTFNSSNEDCTGGNFNRLVVSNAT